MNGMPWCTEPFNFDGIHHDLIAVPDTLRVQDTISFLVISELGRNRNAPAANRPASSGFITAIRSSSTNMEFIREDCIYARQSVDRKDSISIESQIDFFLQV